MTGTAKVLLFHIEPGKTKQIEAVCQSLSIQPVTIPLSSYSQKLGFLSGIPGFKRENTVYQGEEFPAEMMVFCGMDSAMIDNFLGRYKKAFISPIARKAIVTQYNVFWSAEQLYEEISKEHEALSR